VGEPQPENSAKTALTFELNEVKIQPEVFGYSRRDLFLDFGKKVVDL